MVEEQAGAPVAEQPRKHFDELDSIRGLAALGVVFHHWHYVWKGLPHSRYAEIVLQVLPFRFLVSGHSAVLMFFVLSGFVLSLPQIRGKAVHYPSYLVKRICRIYLPYLFALALAVLGCWRFHGLTGYGLWFAGMWSRSPDWHSVIQHILLIGDYNVNRYNTAFWTLVEEMRISLVFPLVCAVVLRFRARGGLAIALGLIGCEVLLAGYTTIPLSYAGTLAFTSFFLLGILVSRYRVQLGRTLWAMSRPAYWAVLGVCVVLYAYSSTVFLRTGDGTPIAELLSFGASDLLTAIGAAGIIVYVLSDAWLSRMILRRSVRFLGRISYSMYLLHGTVLFVFAYPFYEKASPAVWLVPYLGVTVLLSTLMYRFVEAPSIRLGRVLAERLRGKR